MPPCSASDLIQIIAPKGAKSGDGLNGPFATGTRRRPCRCALKFRRGSEAPAIRTVAGGKDDAGKPYPAISRRDDRSDASASVGSRRWTWRTSIRQSGCCSAGRRPRTWPERGKSDRRARRHRRGPASHGCRCTPVKARQAGQPAAASHEAHGPGPCPCGVHASTCMAVGQGFEPWKGSPPC